MTKEKEGTMDLTIVEEKIAGMRQVVAGTVVESEEQLKSVANLIKGIKDMGKFIRQEMEKYTKPAQEIINNARTKFLPYEKECDEAERVLKGKASAYMIRVEAERKKHEDSIARRAEAGQLKEETAVRKMGEIGDEKKTVATESGAKLTLKTVKEVVIVEPEKVPHEYWIINETMVRKAALAGVAIAGVEVRETKQMSA